MSAGKRMLLTTIQHFKEISWSLNGIIKDIGWVKCIAEKSLDHHPRLKEIVSDSIIK